MKKIQPINNNVLIKLDEVKEDKTSGGIIIPDTAKGSSIKAFQEQRLHLKGTNISLFLQMTF